MSAASITLPQSSGLYYGGSWRQPVTPSSIGIDSPADGERLAVIQHGSAADVPLIMAAAREGFLIWRDILPLERSRMLREAASILRRHAEELALLDAVDCGNPVSELRKDVEISALTLDYFAGLVTEIKGASVPQGPDGLSFSVREPYGVVVRIAPFNHPLIFSIGRAAAPLAAGNSIVVKPPEQAPLSALRVAELFDGLLPPGVFNVVPGGRDLGAALVAAPEAALIAVTGSVATGKAVMRAAADRLKHVLLELGGKNALVALPDADPDEVAAAAISGMNFTWCGQSCGSTSRAFIHESIYEEVLARLPAGVTRFRPGHPADPATTMGSLIDRRQYDRVIDYIEGAKTAGARLIAGGRPPDAPELRRGCFIEPTIFADVTMEMRIAREEIFGPVLSILKWSDEEEMMRQVNQVDYGLTFSVFTNDIRKAHRLAARADAGFCWINDVGHHVLGSPFGGFKQSGNGREECLQELISYTQEKNIFVNLRR